MRIQVICILQMIMIRRTIIFTERKYRLLVIAYLHIHICITVQHNHTGLNSHLG